MKNALITIDNISRSFALPNGGNYIALKDIDLSIAEGEFISLIGHSGCGKSTLLNLMAGLDQANTGGILMNSRQVTEPGPDRMVVFQNYSLLPWQTVRQNIALAVNNVMRGSSKAERQERIDQSIELVRLTQAADKLPRELSGGMKQRVAIARALAIRPKLLLLDEPFGALDALTRGNLQQQLMEICQRAGVTTVMVTHSVDEALLLSDRVICLTNGPAAGIGQIVNVNLPRPRQRLEVMEHSNYYALRTELINFLQQQRRLKQHRQTISSDALSPSVVKASTTAKAPATTSQLRIGYLPGLDIAPLAVGIERGFFAESNLQLVPSIFQDWQEMEKQLRSGELDLAITSATAPLAMSLGISGEPAWPAITPITVTRNGNAICLARRFLDLNINSLASLAPSLKRREWPLRLAIGQNDSMQELLLRHWLASAGIDPDQEVVLETLSPMAMQASLQAGEIDGFIAGRYRVAKAVESGLAFVLASDLDIWSNHPEKVITCHEGWATRNETLLLDFCSGLIRGGQICEDGGQHENLVGLLSRPEWLGIDSALALQRQFNLGNGEPTDNRLPLNRYHSDRCHVANAAEGAWILTQFSRWGWIPFPSNRLEILGRVYRNDICSAALERIGLPALRPERQPIPMACGIPFDQDFPINYLQQLPFSRYSAQAAMEMPSCDTDKPLPYS
ncbi:ABC transporter substrate-binding protein [Cyanobium sp. HWJ4-Hawea]|uniref:ABC transporter ATP-binding/substrate-binding protein n=1 Tax=Cyanobium sp. HWJ4-Hawea TaxID=2823713 RepID=UPI0020CC7A97|nr:nitrate ABC transporter ATP-binding protein [Cyanobium sp. HWJ4-Hawea]MCP9809021.1 ABC transporter substrate-binding protein [Cyanobium sp. HWJ4-Hawea]